MNQKQMKPKTQSSITVKLSIFVVFLFGSLLCKQPIKNIKVEESRVVELDRAFTEVMKQSPYILNGIEFEILECKIEDQNIRYTLMSEDGASQLDCTNVNLYLAYLTLKPYENDKEILEVLRNYNISFILMAKEGEYLKNDQLFTSELKVKDLMDANLIAYNFSSVEDVNVSPTGDEPDPSSGCISFKAYT